MDFPEKFRRHFDTWQSVDRHDARHLFRITGGILTVRRMISIDPLPGDNSPPRKSSLRNCDRSENTVLFANLELGMKDDDGNMEMKKTAD